MTVNVSVWQFPTKGLSVVAAVGEIIPGGAKTIVLYSILSLQTSEFALQNVMFVNSGSSSIRISAKRHF